MKQHITPKQLNELSEKGRERLRKWAYYEGQRSRGCDLFTDGKYANTIQGSTNFDVDKHYPLLSIGQMIEFLVDGCIHLPLNDELCDELWDSVKKVLDE